MSTRVTISLGFYFQKEHYAQLNAYLPRTEALKIPQLNCQDNSSNPDPEPEVRSGKPSKQGKSESKRASDEEMSEEDDNDNINDMEVENDDEEDNEIDQEQQQEVQEALQQLEEEEAAESESSSDSYDSDRDDEADDLDSEMLSSPSPRNLLKNQTKRQKGQTKDLIQLPDRRPRKNKNVDEATEVIRRQEKERKRKQYLKKQIEAQEKATIDKILNETGRKLKQREEKEMQEELEREQKSFKTLGDTPKIITLIGDSGKTIMTHKTSLFPAFMTTTRDLKMKELCSNCGNTSKYRLKTCDKYACSLPCYKQLAV